MDPHANGSSRKKENTVERPLVLCLGNSLRGDDGVGWRIGSILLEELDCKSVEIVLSQQLLPEHALLLRLTELAIFVDCSASSRSGEVSLKRLSCAEELVGIFTHHLDPQSMLALTFQLYGKLPNRVLAITVGGESFDEIDHLTPPVQSGMLLAINLIKRELQEPADGVELAAGVPAFRIPGVPP